MKISATHGSTLTHTHRYTFYFKSEENLKIFVREPAKYIPQCGGFCADGIAKEDTWTNSTLGPVVDPDAWLIQDGMLFLFMGQAPKEEFLNNYTANQARARQRSISMMCGRLHELVRLFSTTHH